MVHRSRATFVAFAACCIALVAAQDTTVKCSYADWTNNARGQSSCLVWAEVQTKCDAGGVRVTPLASDRYHYTQPDSEREINDCNCSVVAYNLMAACTFCQLGVPDKWVNETVWRSQCPTYNARGLSVDATGITIPSWATIPVDGGLWRPNIASLAASPSTVTATAGSATTEFTPQSTADSRPHNPAYDKGSNAGAIAGGVVGAVLIVLLFAALFIFFIRRSKRRAEIEARLRATRRRSAHSTHSRTHSHSCAQSRDPTAKSPMASPKSPAVPEMAYLPRCNHGIASLGAGAGSGVGVGANVSPRASTSTAAPTAVDESAGGRTPPKSTGISDMV
ncbi:hypothetical protein BDV93DRAFT_520915 [Ceratobasidium sp. AG-I]|nr:hypothetical protein BDV93DRAFT_520915 [Ceratobasidium sp. AG-I]